LEREVPDMQPVSIANAKAYDGRLDDEAYLILISGISKLGSLRGLIPKQLL
jgi:hypothetical protein